MEGGREGRRVGTGASVNIAKCVRLHLMEGYFGVSMQYILQVDQERRRMRRNRGEAVIDEEAETSNSGGCRRGTVEMEAGEYLMLSLSHEGSTFCHYVCTYVKILSR